MNPSGHRVFQECAAALAKQNRFQAARQLQRLPSDMVVADTPDLGESGDDPYILNLAACQCFHDFHPAGYGCLKV